MVTLDATAQDGGRSGSSDFRLAVPRNTTVIVQNAWGGNISCTGISGDIEVSSMHGEIRLDDVGGGVVVSTMNGQINAGIRELQEGKPLSFTAMNGEVVLRLPENAKANVRLRTQNGSVLTDFDETALVTKTESTAGFSRSRAAFTIRSGKVLATEIQDAIREAAQVSATAVKEALEAVKEGLEASRLDSDDARRQVDDARKEIEHARRDLERVRRDAQRDGRVADTLATRDGELPAPAAPTPPALPTASPPPGRRAEAAKVAHTHHQRWQARHRYVEWRRARNQCRHDEWRRDATKVGEEVR